MILKNVIADDLIEVLEDGKQDARVQAICAATHTAAVVAAYKTAAKP